MSRLDDLVTRGRNLAVREDHARRYVAELSRWARPAAEPSRRWLPWLAGGAALAATAALIVLLVTRPHVVPDASAAIRIGERVAIVVEPNTVYRVLAAEAGRTELLVERGTVTARLWPGAKPHRLALRGGGVEAVATGTVFALEVDGAGARVHVHEGTVAVARGNERAEVVAGTSWPAGQAYRGRRAGEKLLALAAPSLAQMEPSIESIDEGVADAPIATLDAHDVDPATEAAIDAGVSRVTPRPHVVPVDAAPAPTPTPTATLNERYRRARLLRGQGNFDAAIAELVAIADAKDATWSPIALVEAVRIELGPRASPERAVALADRVIADWPSHPLAPEARELRCRALRQLGRVDECDAP